MSSKTTNNLNTSNTSDTLQSSYNDLESEINSQETPSITFGSTEISSSDIPSSVTIRAPKKKLFNFKFVEPDTSYIQQESSEKQIFLTDQEKRRTAFIDDQKKYAEAQYKKVNDAIQKDEIQTETESINDSKNDEILEDSIVASTNETPLESTDDKEYINRLIDNRFITDTPEDTSMSQTDYVDSVNTYDVESEQPELPEMRSLVSEEEEEEPQPTPRPFLVASREIPDPDPDAGLSFNQIWDKQVSLVQRAAGGSSTTRVLDPNQTPKNAFVNKMKDQYNSFKNRDDKDISGIDTLLGFLTIMGDKIAKIFGSIIFFCRKALKYVKGDRTWRNGLGRIFTIFVIAVVFFICFTFLF